MFHSNKFWAITDTYVLYFRIGLEGNACVTLLWKHNIDTISMNFNKIKIWNDCVWTRFAYVLNEYVALRFIAVVCPFVAMINYLNVISLAIDCMRRWLQTAMFAKRSLSLLTSLDFENLSTKVKTKHPFQTTLHPHRLSLLWQNKKKLHHLDLKPHVILNRRANISDFHFQQFRRRKRCKSK